MGGEDVCVGGWEGWEWVERACEWVVPKRTSRLSHNSVEGRRSKGRAAELVDVCAGGVCVAQIRRMHPSPNHRKGCSGRVGN